MTSHHSPNNNQKNFRKRVAILAALILAATTISTIAISGTPTAYGQSPDDIQSKINERTEAIKELEREIAEYQKQIAELGSQASTLSATLKSLDLTRKKLEADIKITENKVADKNAEIKSLGGQIVDKEKNIEDNRRVIKSSLVAMNEFGSRSLPEIMLGNSSIASAWNALDELAAVQRGVADRIVELNQIKSNLEENRRATEKARADLIALTAQLNDQRKVVLNTTEEQNALLKETKQSEAEYQKILAQRKALKESFENEIEELEAALKSSIDPGSIPAAGKGVLRYPLDNIRITQYFGNTAFATQNPSVYNGQGHNGVDFAATIGTPVKSAALGTVVATGNTDLACPRASFGKWILIRHTNGLSTLYAHLSVISVDAGQTVARGETIGYSGNTGFSTGPHLHFTVYASDGVAVDTYNFKSCAGARIQMPLLTQKGAYLNPLSYF